MFPTLITIDRTDVFEAQNAKLNRERKTRHKTNEKLGIEQAKVLCPDQKDLCPELTGATDTLEFLELKLKFDKFL